MKRLLYILILLFPVVVNGQTGDMRVYTVAGSLTTTVLGDGGPATAASLQATEGIWLDGNCSLYISDMYHARVRRVSKFTGIITTIAGMTMGGFSGDGGPATNAKIKVPYGVYVDSNGNVFIADAGNSRIRKIENATGIISTIAGGGSSIGDNVPATDAQLNQPGYVYGDKQGNIYIGEFAKIRKVNGLTGVITTIAGTGIQGLLGDGGLAINAQVYGPAGMLVDKNGNLIFADRGNSRIRKINTSTGIITTIAGSTHGYSGDGGSATSAQLLGPISFAIDYLGNLIIGDNGNNYIRKVDIATGIITTIAGVGTSMTGSMIEGAPATSAEIHPEFLYLDLEGNIYYSDFGALVRKIINYNPGSPHGVNVCKSTDVSDVSPNNAPPKLHPNPAATSLTITATEKINDVTICNLLGQVVATIPRPAPNKNEVSMNIAHLPPGLYFVRVDGVYVGRFVKE